VLEVLRSQAVTGVYRDGVASPRKLGYVSSAPLTCQIGEDLGLEGQTGAVIFCGLQSLQVSKTLLCVTSHSVNVSSSGCDSSSTSKPWFSAIRFPNSLLSPHQKESA
jgi:hypothetical protein